MFSRAGENEPGTAGESEQCLAGKSEPCLAGESEPVSYTHLTLPTNIAV